MAAYVAGGVSGKYVHIYRSGTVNCVYMFYSRVLTMNHIKVSVIICTYTTYYCTFPSIQNLLDIGQIPTSGNL